MLLSPAAAAAAVDAAAAATAAEVSAVANLALWGLKANSHLGAPASTGLMYLVSHNEILHTRDEQKSLSFFHANVNYLFTN